MIAGSRPTAGLADAWFGEKGLLASSLAGFEVRAAQRDLAREVERTLWEGGALVGEAPTGVGKSLAYLVPAVAWAEAYREPVAVSTYTKSLQDQLLRQDVPLLARARGQIPRAVVLKGKANYLCARRYRLLAAERPALRARAGRLESDFASWAETTTSGDLDEFPWLHYPSGTALRARVSADPGFCGAGACRASADCAFRRARREAASADLVIVNHALLVSGRAAGGVLPPFRALVIDEAQHLESALTSQLTTRLTLGRVARALEAWGRGRRRGTGLAGELDSGLFGATADPARAALVEDARRLTALSPRVMTAAKRFFACVSLDGAPGSEYAPRARYRSVEELLDSDLDALDDLVVVGREAESALHALTRNLSRLEPTPENEDLEADATGALEEWRGVLGDLDLLADPRGRERVHWVSGAEPEQTEIAAAPISVADAVQQWLLAELSSLVLVSATLRVGDDFRYLLSRLGLAEESPLEVTTSTYPSPFDWPSRVLALAAREGEASADGVSALVARLHAAVPRNTLVLFTSYSALRRSRALLAERLPRGVPLWAQEVDGEASILSQRFRAARGAVLLGTASFWEGVDFPGEALEVLVVAKLPFAVLNDPLIAARCERVEAEGGNGFRDVFLPDAVLRFRQGVGRLMRRATDRGVVVIADPRALSRSYGPVFRAALPVPLERCAGVDDLVRRAAAFFAAEGPAGEPDEALADAIPAGENATRTPSPRTEEETSEWPCA